jgi:hypothetical protein
VEACKNISGYSDRRSSMMLKELIEYLQQEVKDGTPEDTKLGRLQLDILDKRILSVQLRTLIRERGKPLIRVANDEPLAAAIEAQKEAKDTKAR